MTGRRENLVGFAIALLSATMFAVNGTVSKLVMGHGLSSLRLVEIRCTAAAVVLVVYVLLRRPGSLAIDPREAAALLVLGVLGIAVVQWLYFVAIRRLPVGIGLLVEFTAPLLVALWVRFVRREPVRRRIWAALALSLGGLALVARVWSGLTLDGLGLLAGAGAATSLAAYYLLAERGLGRRDPVSLTAWAFVAAGAFWSVLLPWWTFPFGALGRDVPVPAGATAPLWLLVGWVVLLGTVLPFALVLFVVRLIGAPRAGLLGTSEPVIAGVVAWLALGEVLAPVQIAGCAVVFTGILLAVSARPELPTPDAPVRASANVAG